MALITPTKTEFVDLKVFKLEDAAARYGDTPLPPMPACPQYDPHEMKRPNGPTYIMTKEEEAQRFCEYNYAKWQVNVELARVTRSRQINGRQTRYNVRSALGLARKWTARAEHLREYIMRVNMPLIYSQVARNRYRYLHMDWDEAISETQMPLLRALYKFSPERGCKFSTYACRAILNALTRGNAIAAKKKARVATVELPEAYGEIPDRDDNGVGELTGLLRTIIERNEADLNPDEQLTIVRRFGLEGEERLTLEKVGDIIGVTKERVRQIQNRALSKLRGAMAQVA